MPNIIKRLLGGGPATVPVSNLENMPTNTNLPYQDYGYVPNVAQIAQSNPTPPPELRPQPYFTTAQLAHANWFTTRVHLSPLGKASQ